MSMHRHLVQVSRAMLSYFALKCTARQDLTYERHTASTSKHSFSTWERMLSFWDNITEPLGPCIRLTRIWRFSYKVDVYLLSLWASRSLTPTPSREHMFGFGGAGAGSSKNLIKVPTIFHFDLNKICSSESCDSELLCTQMYSQTRLWAARRVRRVAARRRWLNRASYPGSPKIPSFRGSLRTKAICNFEP